MTALGCPACGANLGEADPAGEFFTCTACGKHYQADTDGGPEGYRTNLREVKTLILTRCLGWPQQSVHPPRILAAKDGDGFPAGEDGQTVFFSDTLCADCWNRMMGMEVGNA